MFRLRTSLGYAMPLCSTALLISPSLADELLPCNAERDTAKRMECLEKNVETLQRTAASNLVQTGGTTFGQNQSSTPNWPFQNLPPSGGTSWTSPRIQFAQSFATKPVVYIAIAGVRSGINLDIDQLDYAIESTDISETGFAVTIRRTHGLLYGVAVNWIAFGPKRP
jgi:H-type lectin domain